jgi:hypothetical protein
MSGIRHNYKRKDKYQKNVHEHKSFSPSSEKNISHGYSVQSSVLQSSGAPEEVPRDRKPITRFNAEGDGDYVIGGIERNASDDTPQPFNQPAGYNLGMGAGKITSPPNMLARGFRQTAVLMSHEGTNLKGFISKDEKQGFRYKAKHNGV